MVLVQFLHTGSMAGNDKVFDAVFKQTGIVRVYSYQEWIDCASFFSKMVPMGVIPKGNRIAVVTNSGGPAATAADLASRNGLVLPELSEETQEKLRKYVPPTGYTSNPIDYTFSINAIHFYNDVPKILSNSGEVDGIICYGAFSGAFFRHGEKGTNIANERKLFAMISQVEDMADGILDTSRRIMKKSKVPIIYINPTADPTKSLIY